MMFKVKELRDNKVVLEWIDDSPGKIGWEDTISLYRPSVGGLDVVYTKSREAVHLKEGEGKVIVTVEVVKR